MHYRWTGPAAALLLALACTAPAAARPDDADPAAARRARVEQFLDGLHMQSGRVPLARAQAHLDLKPGYGFLPAADAQRVLSSLWHNPPDTDVLGMVVPSTDPHVLLQPQSWAVVVTYTDEGHVADGDAARIDYAGMLAKMQKRTHEENPERLKQGYPAIELVGWAEPPRYDAGTHKLYWARELRFTDKDGADEGHTLNYDIRVLGRTGYLSLNAVAPMDQLAQVRADMPGVLAMTAFDPGQDYAAYQPGNDRLAAYGIGALVAGGLAAKAGLFAKLGLLLLAFKKFVVLGIAAVGGFISRLFRRRRA